jgi:hypothetical protein
MVSLDNTTPEPLLRFGALCYRWGQWMGGCIDLDSLIKRRFRQRLSTHLLENGIDNGLMKNLPRHNDLRTIRRYLHVNCKHIRHVEHPLLALVRKQRKRPT